MRTSSPRQFHLIQKVNSTLLCKKMRLSQAILSFQSFIIYLDTSNFCCVRRYVMKVPILVPVLVTAVSEKL